MNLWDASYTSNDASFLPLLEKPMIPSSRREFLMDVGRGMLVAGIGTSVASNLGFSTAFADRGPESLKLGPHE